MTRSEPTNEDYANAVINYVNSVDFKQYFKLQTNVGGSLVFDVLSLHLHHQDMKQDADEAKLHYKRNA